MFGMMLLAGAAGHVQDATGGEEIAKSISGGSAILDLRESQLQGGDRNDVLRKLLHDEVKKVTPYTVSKLHDNPRKSVPLRWTKGVVGGRTASYFPVDNLTVQEAHVIAGERQKNLRNILHNRKKGHFFQNQNFQNFDLGNSRPKKIRN